MHLQHVPAQLSNHHSHLTTAAIAIRSSRHSSHLLPGHAQCAPGSSPKASQHKRSESVSSLLFELELEDSGDSHGTAPRLPLELVWGEGLAANEELHELWKHALKAKEELLEEAAGSGSSNSSVDVAAFAEALAECGYTVWLRRGTYTCPAELGLSHIRHTFVVVSLTADSGSQPAEYYVVDPNYKEHFQLGGSGAGEYQALLALLPSVFVGGAEQWQNLVHLLCKEMERVFDARGVSLPPWRSPSIVLGHWLVNQADDTQVSPSSSTLASRMVSAALSLPGVSGISASMLPVYPHANAAAETLSPPAAADTPTVDELAAV